MTAGAYEDLTGCLVLDAGDRTIGTVSQVYVSDATGQPGWVLVRAEMAGGDYAPPRPARERRRRSNILGRPGPLRRCR